MGRRGTRNGCGSWSCSSSAWSPELPRAPPELPQMSPRAPQSSHRNPLLPLATRHVLPATAGCPPELPRAPPELPCYRWLPGTCSLLPLAVKHTLKAPPSQRRPGGTHSRVRACRGGPERPKIDLEQRPGGIQKCCTVCAGRSFSRVGFEK